MKDDNNFVTVGRKLFKCWSGKGGSYKGQKCNGVD